MNNQRAIRLLNETFNSDFDLNRFIRFTKELFNDFTVDQRDCTKYIANEYKDYILSFVKIGDYENSKKSIEVLVVRLNKTSSRDRARTMQRNFIANWLGKTEKDAALVAFHGDDPEDWRFSFVKMEYRLAEVEPGKVKAVKELTPAKRYSFLVGVNEPNHTCASQFLDLIKEEEINPSLEEIEKAFSIDNVTKEFFTEYKGLFHKLDESLQEIIKKDTYVRQEFEDKSISTVDFAKKLLGQIVFIYFLQKKGWLGVSKDDDGRFKKWGTGPKNFLRRLLDKKIVPYDNFFNEVLEPLFYEALADDRTANHDYYSRFKCKIPFLNGGLFEPINEYDWSGTEIILDNSIFRKIFETFDRFNFTVKEDEPLEKEVAVDPEMLGKVFENLLAVKDRKSKGAFYTPREIVHYMCQQSLINYLETNTSIPRDDIEKFIQFQDTNVGEDIRRLDEFRRLEKDMTSSGNTPIEKIQEKAKEFKTPPSIIKEREKIDKLLFEIKIVDPAVGSGAFPVGMMNEIVKARSVLTNFYPEQEQKKRTEYALKRDVIENSLYGVDIEPSAVEITKLRFWLSLIVDELDMKRIKPLPNLDHKIMCGNSLLEEFEGIKLFDEKLLGEVKKDYSFEIKQIEKELEKLYKEKGEVIRGESNARSTKEIDREIKGLKRRKQKILSGPKDPSRNQTLDEAMQHRIRESQKKLSELKKLQKQFFNEQNRNIKKQLRADIERIEWELIEETLKEQGNEEAMQKLEQYRKNKSKPFFLWKLYFAEVFQRENPGFDVVIANPPYIQLSKTNISNEIRNALLKKYITSSGRMNTFGYFLLLGLDIMSYGSTLTYIIPNTILTQEYYEYIRKKILESTHIQQIVNYNEMLFEEAVVENITLVLKKQKISYEDNKTVTRILMQNKNSIKTLTRIPQSIFHSSYKYSFDVKGDKITSKIDKTKEISPLGELTNINQAIALKGDRKLSLIEDPAKGNEVYKVLDGRNINKYVIKWNKLFLDYDVKKIHSCKRKDIFLSEEKLFFRRVSRNLIFGYDNNQLFALNTLVVVNVKDFVKEEYSIKYLLSLLNSNLINYFYNKKYKSTKKVFSEIQARSIGLLPIKELDKHKQTPFINIVDQILSITKDDDYLDDPDKQAKVKRLEKEIDQLVYKLYELTPEEIEIVEGFDGGK